MQVAWTDTSPIWLGMQPHIEITYDPGYSFLLNVYISLEKRRTTRMSERDLQRIFMTELRQAGVLVEEKAEKPLRRAPEDT